MQLRLVSVDSPRVLPKFRRKSWIKLDIVNLVADRTGVPKQKAEQVVDSLFEAMKEALANGKHIELRGFGVFVVKDHNKTGPCLKRPTGTEVPIPEGKTIRFKPGKELSLRPSANGQT